MRICEKESSDGEFFRSVTFFVAVCGKGQKDVGPTRKLAGEPAQGYGRDYEVLIGLCVDRFDGFYLYLFLEAKFSRCEGRGAEFWRSEASARRI